MGAIAQIYPPFGEPSIKKAMNVTIRAIPAEPEGGVQLTITSVKKGNVTTIKTIVVPEAIIVDMKAAEKGTHVDIGNTGEPRFMSVETTTFVQLITELSQTT